MKPFLLLIGFCVYTLSSLAQGYEEWVKGMDISKHQGVMDWSAVATDSIDFVFIRASQGTGISDVQFERNWAGAKAVEIPRGAYHFYVTSRKGKAQARHFLQDMHKDYGELPMVLDAERLDYANGEPQTAKEKARFERKMRRQMQKFLNYVERKTGRRPLVYSNRSFYDKYLAEAFGDYPLWLARYRRKAPELQHWTFWQFTDRGTVAGINGPVDLNYFRGNEREWLRYLTTQ